MQQLGSSSSRSSSSKSSRSSRAPASQLLLLVVAMCSSALLTTRVQASRQHPGRRLAQDASQCGALQITDELGPPPTDGSCYAANYTDLHNATHRSECGGANKDLLLCCGNSSSRAVTFVRGPNDDPLEMDVSDVLSWHVHGNYACKQKIMINITANPSLPALTVTGHLGINQVILSDLTFVVFGDFAAAGYNASCLDNKGGCPAIIDIINVEDVTLANISVQSLGGQQLPVTGIQIKTTSGGDTRVTLDGVNVTNCVDGIRLLGGGQLNATNVRSVRNTGNGLTYECGFVQQCSISVQGRASLFSSNGGHGIWVNCDGDLSPPVYVNISGTTISKNNASGIYLLGHTHARLDHKVRVTGNGAGATLPPCGGGIYSHFSYATPALEVASGLFDGNRARSGGAICVEGPHDDDSLVKVNGPVSILEGSRFTNNAAVGGCGGVLTTVANISRIRISVNIQNSSSLWSSTSNTAKYAPIWCFMQHLEDQSDVMDIRLT